MGRRKGGTIYPRVYRLPQGSQPAEKVTQGHSPAPQGYLMGPLSGPHLQSFTPRIPELSRNNLVLLEDFSKMSSSKTRGSLGRSEIS